MKWTDSKETNRFEREFARNFTQSRIKNRVSAMVYHDESVSSGPVHGHQIGHFHPLLENISTAHSDSYRPNCGRIRIRKCWFSTLIKKRTDTNRTGIGAGGEEYTPFQIQRRSRLITNDRSESSGFATTWIAHFSFASPISIQSTAGCSPSCPSAISSRIR